MDELHAVALEEIALEGRRGRSHTWGVTGLAAIISSDHIFISLGTLLTCSCTAALPLLLIVWSIAWYPAYRSSPSVIALGCTLWY